MQVIQGIFRVRAWCRRLVAWALVGALTGATGWAMAQGQAQASSAAQASSTAQAASPAQPPASPGSRWVTASGNLELEVAPCGAALCGTVTKVLGNRSMSPEGGEMNPVDTRPALGMVLLTGFERSDGGDANTAPSEWSGEIYNRENGKTYRCRMSVSTQDRPEGELVLRAYVGIPLFGKTQVWRRASGTAAAPQAPQFEGITQWFNSPPLSMAGLRGKVVLVDFWTSDCSNCMRALPHVQRWHERYKAQGLVVIGVHTPEFAAERDAPRLQATIARRTITYPVAQDNGFHTWAAWRNQAWPSLYLVDRQGRVLMRHVGEGDYAHIEAQIVAALR